MSNVIDFNELKEKTNADIYIHEKDKEALINPEKNLSTHLGQKNLVKQKNNTKNNNHLKEINTFNQFIKNNYENISKENIKSLIFKKIEKIKKNEGGLFQGILAMLSTCSRNSSTAS